MFMEILFKQLFDMPCKLELLKSAYSNVSLSAKIPVARYIGASLISTVLAFILTCLFQPLAWADPPNAQIDPDQQLARPRLLYSCFSFFSTGSRIEKSPQKEKLQKIANLFLNLGGKEVLLHDPNKDPTNTEFSRRISQLGETDLKTLMEEVKKLPTQTEKDEKLAKFVKSCFAAAFTPASAVPATVN
jgi:hypothetical protein